MILRRLTKHIEDQNWFAVALDFLIVVVGVFIGLQVGNLNEHWQERGQYDEAFDRVVTEIKYNLRGQEFIAGGIRAELPIIQRAIADLQACRTGEDATANISAALVPLMNPYIFQVEDDALVRLRNNDDFSKYQTPQQREAFFRLFRMIKYLRITDTSYRQTLLESSKDGLTALQLGAESISNIDEYVDFIVEENPLSAPNYRAITLPDDLSSLCTNGAFLSWLYDWEAHGFSLAVSEGRLTNVLNDTLDALNRPMVSSGENSQ